MPKVKVKKYAVELHDKKYRQDVTWETDSHFIVISKSPNFVFINNTDIDKLIEALQAIKEKQEELNA